MVVALAALSSGAALAADSPVAMELAKKANCLACHSVEAKLVGPSFKDVAAKRKNEEGAEDMLVAKVRKGGAGVYGPIPMPPNPAAKEEDVRHIVKYVLSL